MVLDLGFFGEGEREDSKWWGDSASRGSPS